MLATVAQLKDAVGVTSTEHDTELTRILGDVSSAIEQHLGNRPLIHPGTDVTEDYDGGLFDVQLRRWPIPDAQAVTVKVAVDRDFASATDLVVDEDYYLDRAMGVISRLPDRTCWESGRGVIRVTYAGGYADPNADPTPAGVATLPGHIRQAALLQAAHEWDRKRKPGASSEGMAGGSVGWVGQVALLKGVGEMLVTEKRC